MRAPSPWSGAGRSAAWLCLVILRDQTIPTERYKKGDFERPIAHRDYITSPGRDRRSTTSATAMILVAAMKVRHADILAQ